MTHIIIPIYSCGLCLSFGFIIGSGEVISAKDWLSFLFWPVTLILIALNEMHKLALKYITPYDLLWSYTLYVLLHRWFKVHDTKYLQRWLDSHAGNNLKTKLVTKIIKLNA
jgi:hypothetical protein